MDLQRLEDKTVFITGASGLIGKAIVSNLLSYKGTKPINVIALVRNEEKARKVFNDLPRRYLKCVVCDVCDLKAENLGVDYIIHGANMTSSRDFVTKPVEVISNALKGTGRVLDFARINDVKGMVYLSTMEVYGTPTTDDEIGENSATNINTMCVRSSYPESKRLCENLCASYASEYGVPAKVVRLTQTFGEGVDYNDSRIFAELARCVIEGRDIILKTKGETKRNYLYIGDAVEAILTVLFDGAVGEAYNASNENTYCSVFDMACMVAEKFGNGKTKVIIREEENVDKLGYAPTLKMNLNSEKLQSLGWTAKVGLIEAFSKMIENMIKSAK